jgi:hypothetical protein
MVDQKQVENVEYLNNYADYKGCKMYPLNLGLAETYGRPGHVINLEP